MSAPHPSSFPLALLVLAVVARAQSPAWDPEFAAPGLAARALSFCTWRGELYAGAEAQCATKGGYLMSIARFDGSAWRPVGSGVSAGPNVDATVRALIEFQGELIAAGEFTAAGGLPAASIARWDGATWRPLGAGLTLSFGLAEVRALAVFNQRLYACGYFDAAGGQPARGFARWDGNAWQPVTSGFLDSASNTLARAKTMLVANGLLYVGGDFDRAGGIVAAHVAAFDGTRFVPLGSGTNAAVNSLAEYGGEIVAGGTFSFAGGQWAPMVAAWNGAGWRALGSNGPDRAVLALRRFGVHLYAGGHFTNHGPHLSRWDGNAWAGVGGVDGVFRAITTPFVATLHEHAGQLVVGGEFTRAGRAIVGPEAVVAVGAVAFDGAVTWRQLGTGLGVNGTVRRLIRWRHGFVAIGNFTEVGALHSPHLALFDGDRWRSLGRFDGPTAAAVAWRGDLIVSGAFTTIDGRPIPLLARFDGTTWQPFGTPRLMPLAVHGGELYGGTSSELLKWNGTDFAPVAATGGIVSLLHSHADGRLYVVTSTASSQGVHAWDGTALRRVGTPSQPVHCIDSFGADLVIGGRFAAVSGVAANLIARWDGAAWSPLAGGVAGYAVDALADLEGVLHAAVSGDPRGFVLRHVAGAWQALPTMPNGVPQSLFVDRATASLWAGGTWFEIGALPEWNFGVWHTMPAWRNRLHGGGSSGLPLLSGRGALQPATPFTLGVEGPAHHVGVLVLGGQRIDASLCGNTLVPAPDLLLPIAGDAGGRWALATPWPAGIARGSRLFWQAWLLDAAAPQGLAASNALECTAR